MLRLAGLQDFRD